MVGIDGFPKCSLCNVTVQLAPLKKWSLFSFLLTLDWICDLSGIHTVAELMPLLATSVSILTLGL